MRAWWAMFAAHQLVGDGDQVHGFAPLEELLADAEDLPVRLLVEVLRAKDFRRFEEGLRILQNGPQDGHLRLEILGRDPVGGDHRFWHGTGGPGTGLLRLALDGDGHRGRHVAVQAHLHPVHPEGLDRLGEEDLPFVHSKTEGGQGLTDVLAGHRTKEAWHWGLARGGRYTGSRR